MFLHFCFPVIYKILADFIITFSFSHSTFFSPNGFAPFFSCLLLIRDGDVSFWCFQYFLLSESQHLFSSSFLLTVVCLLFSDFFCFILLCIVPV